MKSITIVLLNRTWHEHDERLTLIGPATHRGRQRPRRFDGDYRPSGRIQQTPEGVEKKPRASCDCQLRLVIAPSVSLSRGRRGTRP